MVWSSLEKKSLIESLNIKEQLNILMIFSLSQ